MLNVSHFHFAHYVVSISHFHSFTLCINNIVPEFLDSLLLSNFSPRRGSRHANSCPAAYSVKTQFSSIIIIVYTVVACIDRSLGAYI